MLQSIDLDTLYHILKHYGEDVFTDSCQIICKLLDSLSDTITPEDLKIFTAVKVLLNLCEKILKNDSEIKSWQRTFPTDLLIKNIKKVLHDNNDSFCIDNDIQLEVLSIFHCLFKILSLENSSEAVEKLSNLYDHCLTCLYAASAEKRCRPDCMIFKLKMVQAIYNLLRSGTYEAETAHFYEESRSNKFNETEVFTELVLNGVDALAVHTVLFVIPGYIACFKTDIIFPAVWKAISDSVTDSSVNYSRAMLILCSFFDKYFDKPTETKEFHLNFLFEDSNYWELIQSALVKSDPIIRKQGMFIFKKTIEALHTTTNTIVCSKCNTLFYWDSNLKDKLYKMYNEIITILEFLDEQQLHIIKPAFELAETVLKDIKSCNEVSIRWALVIYHKALNHDSVEVVRWGLHDFLHSSEFIFSLKESKEYFRKIVSLLLSTLNRPALYYTNGLSVSQDLGNFFSEILFILLYDPDFETLSEDEWVVKEYPEIGIFFFSLFIQQVCSSVWSPEALFFVIHGLYCFLQKNNRQWIWGQDEISQIRTFVMKAFKTYHKIIATAIQCEFLHVVIQMTDLNKVPLKNFLLLVSSFPLMRSPQKSSELWREIIHTLQFLYSAEDAREVFDSFKRQALGEEFNEQSTSLTLILLGSSRIRNLVAKWMSKTLSLFKGIDSRPYCERSVYDQYLSLFSHIYKANVDDPDREMLVPGLPLLKEVKSYIFSQLRQISELRDFDTCQLYLSAFESIVKIQKALQVGSEEISSTYADVLNELETCLHTRSENPAIGLYCWIQLLNVLLRLHPGEVKANFLTRYLLTEVNVPLEKEVAHREYTKDIQVLWGRVNSDFIEAKWAMMAYLIDNDVIIHGPDPPKAENAVSDDDLVELCMEVLQKGGYRVLLPVMSVLKTLLPAMTNCSTVRHVIASVWNLMMERRKTEEFKSFAKGFVEMLFQRAFILKGESVQGILIEYADEMFSNPSLVMVTGLMRHVQTIDLAGSSESLFCHIVGKALVFGPVQRRDEKLTTTVCAHIDRLKICPVWGAGSVEDDTPRPSSQPWLRKPKKYSWTESGGDHLTSNEIRARAVERILTLRKDSERDKAIAGILVKTLLTMEAEVGKSRERYFADSHVHRVKHRVMQALLLLEPLLSQTQDWTTLFHWLLNSLSTENLQPSVRRQREWLLIRMMVENRFSRFHVQGKLQDFKDISSRGLCSLMSVQFHFSQLCHEDQTHNEIDNLVPLLLHQHFEVRLYAQVFICYQYQLASMKEIRPLLNTWYPLSDALDRVSKAMMKQNVKNYRKLIGDFFFRDFMPLEHYSLETIYFELPKADKVGSDEWISTKLFQYCGVDPSKIDIPFENTCKSLNNHQWSEGWTRSEDASTELKQILNYQKKITPNWDKGRLLEEATERKDGLVVVASLIDRVPNLGGLARTCEIFGASEYVIGSLRYAEDKQFTSLSVTAEKWIALKEVKANNLMMYILEMKQNGYTVVGAEQSLHSRPLDSVNFPKKTLLLLGNEKEGIPPNLLQLLDICVEIPQVGIIRSLNVHVTGALFIWEYAKQNNFSNSAPDE